jgi:hypothetical protein
MFAQGLLAKSTWSMLERAGADVKGSTRFKLKGKGSKTDVKVDKAKERSKLLDMLERYGKTLSYPRPIKPVQTPEQMEESRRVTLLRHRMLKQREFELLRRETTYIKLRTLAFEELPSESLKKAASVRDETPVPPDFITIWAEPPIEGEEVFGFQMTAESVGQA